MLPYARLSPLLVVLMTLFFGGEIIWQTLGSTMALNLHTDRPRQTFDRFRLVRQPAKVRQMFDRKCHRSCQMRTAQCIYSQIKMTNTPRIYTSQMWNKIQSIFRINSPTRIIAVAEKREGTVPANPDTSHQCLLAKNKLQIATNISCLKFLLCFVLAQDRLGSGESVNRGTMTTARLAPLVARAPTSSHGGRNPVCPARRTRQDSGPPPAVPVHHTSPTATL